MLLKMLINLLWLERNSNCGQLCQRRTSGVLKLFQEHTREMNILWPWVLPSEPDLVIVCDISQLDPPWKSFWCPATRH